MVSAGILLIHGRGHIVDAGRNSSISRRPAPIPLTLTVSARLASSLCAFMLARYRDHSGS